MASVNTWIKWAYTCAVEHGWHEKKRDICEITNLINDEVSEALEELRNGKPYIYYEMENKVCDECLYEQIEGALCVHKGGCPEGRKPEGFVIELTDVIIRCLDAMGEYGLKLEEDRPFALVHNDFFESYAVQEMNEQQLIARLHKRISDIPYAVLFDASAYLNIIQTVYVWLTRHGYNVEQLVHEKYRYNLTRSYKHGNKAF